MENIYEEGIVREACKRLEKAKGIQIEVLEVVNKEVIKKVSSILMSFRMGKDKHNQTCSCTKETFYNPEKAAKLPLVDQLIAEEQIKKLDKRSFIVLCFAA